MTRATDSDFPATDVGRHFNPVEGPRLEVHDGQCGLCTHFGEHHLTTRDLIQIRRTHAAPETLVDECGHPRHATLNLRVTPISGCDGFEPAQLM